MKSWKNDLCDKQLNKLLHLIDNNIDVDHCREVDQRIIKSFSYQSVDRLPFVILPSSREGFQYVDEPWNGFFHYPYGETFNDPCKMLTNILLDNVVPGILLKDDSPLAVKCNYGTVILSTAFGCNWDIFEDDYPWVEPFESMDDIKKITADIDDLVQTKKLLIKGIIPCVINALEFFNEKMHIYPKLKKHLQISLPGLQGPLNVVSEIWGSDIYYSFFKEDASTDLLKVLLEKTANAILFLKKEFEKFTIQRNWPFISTDMGYVVPGEILIKNDSSVMLSPQMYEEYVMTADALVLEKGNGGGIHFCGNGEQLVDSMLKIPNMKGIDLGQPECVNIDKIYEKCKQNKVVITNLDLSNKECLENFKTGVLLTYSTNDFLEAKQISEKNKHIMEE